MQVRNLQHKFIGIFFSSSYNVFNHNIWIYHICIIYILCHNVFISKHEGRISWLLCFYQRCVHVHRQEQFWSFTNVGKLNCALVMTVRLDKYTKRAKWWINYEFQKYA